VVDPLLAALTSLQGQDFTNKVCLVDPSGLHIIWSYSGSLLTSDFSSNWSDRSLMIRVWRIQAERTASTIAKRQYSLVNKLPVDRMRRHPNIGQNLGAGVKLIYVAGSLFNSY